MPQVLTANDPDCDLWAAFLAQLLEILQTPQRTDAALPSPFRQLKHVIVPKIIANMEF